MRIRNRVATDDDPDSTAQRHIDMALERAELDRNPPPSPSKVCSTKEIWWQCPCDNHKPSQHQPYRDFTKQAPPLLLSHEDVVRRRAQRHLSGAKRLGRSDVLRVTSLQQTTKHPPEEICDVAVSNSSFAHVKKALTKKSVGYPNLTSLSMSSGRHSATIPRNDVVLVGCKPGTAGFFDWTRQTSSKKQLPMRCRSTSGFAASRNNRKNYNRQQLNKSTNFSIDTNSEDFIFPKSSKCELSIRLPTVSYSHKAPSTSQSTRRIVSNENKSKSGSCGQIVFNKCNFQPTFFLGKGLPKALQL